MTEERPTASYVGEPEENKLMVSRYRKPVGRDTVELNPEPDAPPHVGEPTERDYPELIRRAIAEGELRVVLDGAR